MEYIGEELELFSHAKNWKSYYYGKIKKYLTGDVLEVGAGIGTTTQAICDGTQKSWTCLEPDEKLSAVISQKINSNTLPACCKSITGTIDNIATDKYYDAILYMDVIEHIENDKGELANAVNRLKKKGCLIILVPAHNALYSNFDKKIGHFRRYNKDMIRAVLPGELEIIKLNYLDSLGYIMSLTNKLFLRQSYPTVGQIKFWDRVIIPFSKIIDTVSFNSIGKSVLLVARK